MDERRNPYLILGLDFAATAEESLIAFARTSKRIRRGTKSFTMQDATWALHQIEQASTDPLVNLNVYRVPANPALFDPPTTVGSVAGAPRNLERQSPTDQTVLSHLRARVLTEAFTEPLLAQTLAPFVDTPKPDPRAGRRPRP